MKSIVAVGAWLLFLSLIVTPDSFLDEALLPEEERSDLAFSEVEAAEPEPASNASLSIPLAVPLKPVPVPERRVSRNPQQLVIPSINVAAPIVPTTVTDEGKMDVPDNYTEVGWYAYGAHPGEKGSAVLGAHVDNAMGLAGVFKKLKNVKVGDSISIIDADGTVVHFQVKKIVIYPHDSKDTQAVFNRTDGEYLNLITCHGTWKQSLKTYTERLVVFSERVR